MVVGCWSPVVDPVCANGAEDNDFLASQKARGIVDMQLLESLGMAPKLPRSQGGTSLQSHKSFQT